MSDELCARIPHSYDPAWDVFVEDDGRTGYAYLRHRSKIVGDVWLYNRAPTPAHVDWSDRGDLPYPNRRELGDDLDVPPPSMPTDLSAYWFHDDIVYAGVFVRGELFGILGEGRCPGWSRLARRPGPLALPLDDAPLRADGQTLVRR